MTVPRRRLALGAAGALVALALGGVLATTLPGTPLRDDHEFGRAVYNYRCYFCHGYSGDAKTLAATYLDPVPASFRGAAAHALTPERILATLRRGRPGTAMKSFTGILTDAEMRAVAAFVRSEFVERGAPNTRYHTAENGWPDHERFRVAFPFATGEEPLDTRWEDLDAEGVKGKQLFLAACVSCHDRARVSDEGPAWDSRPVSFPQDGHDCTSCHDRSRYADRGPPSAHKPDSYHARDGIPRPLPAGAAPDGSGADVYSRHDVPPRIEGLTDTEQRGARLYLANCAFCHAADGTGRNWIGRFLEPHPRDLTSREEMKGMTRSLLASRIREGLPGTSMPAWERVLAPADIDAIVAYVARAFGGVAADGTAARASAFP